MAATMQDMKKPTIAGGFTSKLKNTLKRTLSIKKKNVVGAPIFSAKVAGMNSKLDELMVGLEALDIESVDCFSGSNQQTANATAQTLDANVNDKTPLPDKLSMDDFDCVKAIGNGSYGYVSLYRHKATQLPCVIKSVSKSMTFLKREQQHALNERDALALLASTNCPFAIRGYGTFQDDTHLHYVMEYVPGGEFFSYMVEYDTFNEDDAKFFVAQLLVVLEHMHSQDLAYRDIKPENMLIDEKGYLKVCDFGFAKTIHRGDRSWTLCGTPEYLARESLLGKGHDKAVDLWAVGNFAYELLVGRTPFEGGCSSGTHTKILSSQAVYPTSLSDEVVDFIDRLLCPDAHDRLGCGPHGFKEIYTHTWFEDFDWDGLKSRTLVSPLNIVVAHDFDVTHFNGFNCDQVPDLAPVTAPMNEFFKDFDCVFDIHLQ